MPIYANLVQAGQWQPWKSDIKATGRPQAVISVAQHFEKC